MIILNINMHLHIQIYTYIHIHMMLKETDPISCSLRKSFVVVVKNCPIKMSTNQRYFFFFFFIYYVSNLQCVEQLGR